MARAYWLIKSEADEYGWKHLVDDGEGVWDGVRNYAARNHLRQMKLGDYALFYHTGKERAVVGIAEVVKEHYPDSTAEKGDFSAVNFRARLKLASPVTLKAIKAEPSLSQMVLARSPRLSVQPVSAPEFRKVLDLAHTQYPQSSE